jgi:hypothetical protein
MTVSTRWGGDGVTLGDAVTTKSPYEMIYRKVTKTASLPVTCHPGFVRTGFLCLNGMVTGWIDLVFG